MSLQYSCKLAKEKERIMAEFTLVPTIGKDGIVRTNAKELMALIEPELKKYNYVVDESNTAEAKADRTKLNNLVKKVQSERKKIEDDVFGEWKKEKADIMALEKKLQATADSLGNGINSVEESAKMEKKKQIEEYWMTLTNKYPFELVFEKKMLNKTCSTKSIEEYLKKVLAKAMENEQVMETFLPEDKFQAEQVKDVFYRTMDLSMAKAKADELSRISSQIKEEEAIPQVPEKQPEEKAENPQTKEPEQKTIYGATFSVEGTYDDMANLSKELVILFKKYGIKAKVERKWSR